jgi:hypothetical protein
VADLLAGVQAADDVDALAEPGVAHLLARPDLPVMCSLDASPVPSAVQNRPGYIALSVAMACAMITGW